MSEENIKQKILKQLDIGACCRTHLHNECRSFGLDEIGKNRSSDRRFDNPFDELLAESYIRKIQPKSLTIDGDDRKNWKNIKLQEIIDLDNKTIEKIGKYAFYEITNKGKAYLKTL